MNKQYLLIILIISLGITGIAYATSTTINYKSIATTTLNTTNVFLKGFCNSCGSELSYSNYNTIFLNTTVAPAIGVSGTTVYISNNAVTLALGVGNVLLISSTGSLLQSSSFGSNIANQVIAQSTTGDYQVIGDGEADNVYQVYKNGVFLQNLGFNFGQIENGAVPTVGMSPSGQYIVVVGNNDASTTRVVIFKGS